MKILAVHNRYLIGGGEDISHQAEVDLLRAHGHVVDEYVEDNHRVAELGTVRTAFRSLWSWETYNKVRLILKRTGYDLVLVQNFFPLISPSIFYAAKKEGVPTIHFLRNFRLVCLNGTLFRDSHICEDCLGKCIPWPGVIHRCYRGSLSGSVTVCAMLVLHRLFGTWKRKVSRFVALSQFSYDKLTQAGLPRKKISIRSNFIYPDPGEGTGGDYALFVGRLSEEKGIKMLLDTWVKLEGEIELKIIGDGQLASMVQNSADRLRSITYLGRQSYNDTLLYMKGAYCLIFPSLWFEGMPRTILEAFAGGTSVIVSDLGTMREMVEKPQNGLLFEPGNVEDLISCVRWAYANQSRWESMRKTTRQRYLAHYTADLAYDNLIKIIEDL